jgi:hypothetical protein
MRETYATSIAEYAHAEDLYLKRLRPTFECIWLACGPLFVCLAYATGGLPAHVGDRAPFAENRHTHFSAFLTNVVFCVALMLFSAFLARLVYSGGTLWRPAAKRKHLQFVDSEWMPLGEVSVGRCDVFLALVLPEHQPGVPCEMTIRLTAKVGPPSCTLPEKYYVIETFSYSYQKGARSPTIMRCADMPKGAYEVQARLDGRQSKDQRWMIAIGTGPAIAGLIRGMRRMS